METRADAHPQLPTPSQAAVHGAAKGAVTGLVLGILWGVWEEKKFVFRNCLKEYHLRENPIRLFSVMQRSVTTAPVVATFMGVHYWLRCWWQHRQLEEQQRLEQQQQQQLLLHQQHEQPLAQPQPQLHAGQLMAGAQQQPALGQQLLPGLEVHHPLLAGAAGTAAGAVRSMLAEAAAAIHPLIHVQRAGAAGAAAAGIFALGGYLEQQQVQPEQQQRRWQQRQQQAQQQQLNHRRASAAAAATAEEAAGGQQ